MSRDIRTLERRLRRVSERIEAGLGRFVGIIGEEIGERVVLSTPVVTGFARANWRPSLNAPVRTAITFNDPTGLATTARIATTARQYRLGDQMFIVNNAPYIVRLNQGSSPQAQAGFVGEAVSEGLRAATARFADEGIA